MNEKMSTQKGLLKDILDGKQRIVSHVGTTSESTSAFQVGTSACLSLNCARVAFQYQDVSERNPSSCNVCKRQKRPHDKVLCLFDGILSPQASDVSRSNIFRRYVFTCRARISFLYVLHG